MNEPIISPWILYLIEVLNNFSWMAWIVLVVSLIATYIFLCCFKEFERNLIDYEYRDKHYTADFSKEIYNMSKNKKLYKRLTILGLLIAVFSFLSLVFLPSEETCYKMLVADQLTYENVDKLGDSAKDTVDYIFDKIEEVQNGSTESEGK